MKFNPMEHLIDLKGKQYLQVMWRLVWFREDKPNWCIDTELVSSTEKSAVFVAKIFDENGILKASGHGSETQNDFRDFMEKAETKAIGRALAMLGYGTQFAPELDEETRIVDSPVPMDAPNPAIVLCADCGQVIQDKNGVTADRIAKQSSRKYGRMLCYDCGVRAKEQAELDKQYKGAVG